MVGQLMMLLLLHSGHGCQPADPTARAAVGTIPTEVLMVAGGDNGARGYNALSSVSAHQPGRPACRLPSLPAGLTGHTLNSVAGVPTVCGGRDNNDTMVQTCLQLEGSSWRHVATLHKGRANHYSWLLPEGLLLLGGSTGGEYSRTTELAVATGDQQPGTRFTMDTGRGAGCSIITPGGLVLTGGTVKGEPFSRRVTRLSPAGRPTELPGLGTGRSFHGCGMVTTGQREVLVVAGGLDAGSELLASTEVLVAGSPAWAVAGRLPSARAGLRGASLGGRLYMAGGLVGGLVAAQSADGGGDFTAEILEFNERDTTWETAGPPMDEARALHGMAAVPYTAVQRFCPGW